MEIIYAAAGFIAGALIAYLIASIKFKSRQAADEVRIQNLETSLQQKIEESTARQRSIDEKQLELNQSSERLAQNDAQISMKDTALREQVERISQLQCIEEKLRDDISTLQNENAKLSAGIEVQTKEIEEIRQKFSAEFENLSNKIFTQKTHEFKAQNIESLNLLLRPLGENLEQFKKKVEELYINEEKERFSLVNEINRLVEKSDLISKDANNLTRALKGDSKVQGDWGEMILERILENSGLQKGIGYFCQESTENLEGKEQRPDVIIRYPGGRSVIIDSKVSLTAYSEFIASEDPKQQKIFAKNHLASVKRHIDELKEKNYPKTQKNSPDFVMMFIPNEPAYSLALQQDPTLWEYAYSKKILIMNPMNLITALRLAYELWTREAQEKNVKAIVDRGEKLYEKFVSFSEEFLKIGKSINGVTKAYEGALNLLNTGNGNLVRQAQQLKDLGINPKKSMPKELTDSSEIEVSESV